MSLQLHPDARGEAWLLALKGRLPAPSLVLPLLLLGLLRLPSLFEPHWYSDEAGYANTAYLMAHGKVLYLTVWNNKPPLLFWIYQLALGGFGPSELGLHLLSLVSEATALGGIWALARGWLSPRRTWAALLFSAFMLGTPLVNGDLALPESFLIALTVWGMVAVLAGLRARSTVRALWLAVAAGLLLGLACLIQQTALADAVAALLVLLTAGWRGVRLGLAAGLSLGVTIAAVLAPFVVAAGAHRVFFFLVTSFAGYAQPALGGGLLLVLPRVAAAVLLLAGVWATRGWPDRRRLSWVWLGCVLLVYVLPNRPYAHFLLPAIPALALVLARLPRVHPRLLLHRVERAGRPLVASVALSGLLWAGVVAGGFTGGSLFTAKLTGEYYPVFVGRALGLVSPVNYVSTYGAVPLAERSAVAWMRAHRAANRTAVVWSPDSWAYLLARLRPVLPAPPIYVDQEWLGTRRLLRRVTARQPALILVTPGALTAYGPIAGVLRADYTRVAGIEPGQLWVRANVARRISRTRDATRGAGAGVAARGRPPTRRSA